MRLLRASLIVLAGLLLSLPLLPAEEKKDEKSKPPPKDAVVVFDGKSLDGWVTRTGKEAGWKVENGYMQCVPGSGDIRTKDTYGPDFLLHCEFWLPLMEKEKGQGRANSGVFLQGRYEIQVLDSYMNETYPDGSVGALYKLLAPDKQAQEKAVKPPQLWNSYDLTLHSPRVDDSNKVKEPGRITVVLNGVTLIDDGKFTKVCGGAIDEKLGEPGPILLQDHNNTVRYRNIWLKPLK